MEDETTKLYKECELIEQEFRTVLKNKSSIFDKNVQRARDKLKDLYEKILLTNYDFAANKEIESSLWKSVFYKVIEEYRQRLRKALTIQKEPNNRNKNGSKEELKKLSEMFRKFLEASSAFYHGLISSFQEKYSLKLDGPIPEEDRNQNLFRHYVSCHRSLIYIGDLARYHKDLYGDPANKEWVKANIYYTKALKLWPENGHPHNQLAVLCTYKEDEFRTLYHYFRSLAVKIPFTTAKDNLTVLFEKNKNKYENPELSKPKSTEKLDKVEKFLKTFVRVHGILFTKTGIESLTKIKEKLMEEMDILFREGLLREETVLQMFVCNIFAVHNLSKVSDRSSQPDDIPKNTLYYFNAVCFSIACFSSVLQQSLLNLKKIGEDTNREKNGNTTLKTFNIPISIFASWLTLHPEYLKRPEKNTELSLWLRLRELVASKANQILTTQKDDNMETNVHPPVSEEIELQGFLPLQESLNAIDFTCKSLDNYESERRRRFKIINFSLTVSSFDWAPNELFIYFDPSKNKFSTVAHEAPIITKDSTNEKHNGFDLPEKHTTILQNSYKRSIDDNSAMNDDSLSEFQLQANSKLTSKDVLSLEEEDDLGDEIVFCPVPNPKKYDYEKPSSPPKGVIGSERTRQRNDNPIPPSQSLFSPLVDKQPVNLFSPQVPYSPQFFYSVPPPNVHESLSEYRFPFHQDPRGVSLGNSIWNDSNSLFSTQAFSNHENQNNFELTTDSRSKRNQPEFSSLPPIISPQTKSVSGRNPNAESADFEDDFVPPPPGFSDSRQNFSPSLVKSNSETEIKSPYYMTNQNQSDIWSNYRPNGLSPFGYG